MNWIANLYDQGINGILADEMGLGKTVQSVAFLAHLAEVGGPTSIMIMIMVVMLAENCFKIDIGIQSKMSDHLF